MFVLPCSPINFLFKKSKGANFVKECPIIISNRWYKILFQEGIIFLKNSKTGFFCFLVVGEGVSILKIYFNSILRLRGSLCHTEQNPPTACSRGWNPVAVNQLFFSCLFSSHVLTFFLKWKYSYFFALLFFAKNEAEIIQLQQEALFIENHDLCGYVEIHVERNKCPLDC